MPLKLPPADTYRAPFVEPIGHLAMQAAQADQTAIALIAAIPFDGSSDQLAPPYVESRLRYWNASADAFAKGRLSMITDPDLRRQAEESLDRFKRARNARNRVIHDAVEVGIDLDGSVHSLAVQYAEGEDVWLHKVTPEQIAALAREIYDLNQDLKIILSLVRNSGQV